MVSLGIIGCLKVGSLFIVCSRAEFKFNQILDEANTSKYVKKLIKKTGKKVNVCLL